jgi:hypothetical protein
MEKFVLAWIVGGALIGALLGDRKGRAGFGAASGLILGPLGWIWVALGPDKRPPCPHCGKPISGGLMKCPSCGQDPRKAPTARNSKG